MPSPFPGMDPYLERQETIGGLCASFVIYLCEFLQAVLPEPYFATTGRRTWFKASDDEYRETFVEIIRADDDRERLVTVIEVLSPANKTPGEQGRDLYLRKQREVLGSKIHLVEIDLLRGGEHTTAIPNEYLVREAAPFDYHVCIHRFDNLEDYFVYPILLSQALPEIAIPLMPGDGEVTIDAR